jgi:hypothetical protein
MGIIRDDSSLPRQVAGFLGAFLCRSVRPASGLLYGSSSSASGGTKGCTNHLRAYESHGGCTYIDRK